MTRQTIISYIRRVLPESIQPWITSALLQNQCVWESLQDPDFAQSAALQFNSDPSAWSPGALALLSLDIPFSKIGLHITPSLPLEQNLLQQANLAFQSFNKTVQQDLSAYGFLQKAGLIALWFLDRHQKQGTWKVIIEEVFVNHTGSILEWKTVFACLYSLTSKPLEFLTAIIADQDTLPAHQLALSVLFSNPVSPDDQLRILQDLLNQPGNRPKPEWILSWLVEQRPELAKRFSHWLLENDIPPSGYEHSGRIASLLHEIKNLSWQANLYQSAGNIAESLELLTQAEKQTSWLIAEINADWAGQAINYVSFPASPEAVSSAWTKAIKSAPVSEESRNNLPYVSGHLLSQIRYGIINAIDIDISALDSGNVNDIRTGYPTGILLEYIRQCITAGEIEQARNLAQKAYLDISNIELTQLNSGSMFSTLEELGKILLEIALPKEATLVAKKIVSAVPTNFAALQMLGFACNAQGEFLAALKAFSAASLLVPDDLDLRRKLASALEMCDDWEAALFERDQIAMVSAGSDTTDTLSDLHALARTALKANAFQQTVDTCQKILDQQPNDWETHYLLGKVFTAIGDHDQACDHFNHAIQAAPHQAGPWLQLASIYKKNDDRLKAVETLSAAIQAVSDDPELYLAYGEALLDQNSPTQALPCFQKAHDLAKALTDPRNPTLRDAGSHLSKVLFDLGHLDKAREIIAPIFNNHPTSPSIAHVYAKVLTALQDYEGAITPLEIAIQAFPEDAQLALEYGRTLLALARDPALAATYLRKTLQVWPEHPEAHALLAEALAACGDHQTAMKIFSTALEGELGKQPEWQVRISIGLGRSALILGQTETALAALQEAVNFDPKNSTAQRALSETFWSAGLQHEAWNTAQAAMRLDPTPETALWFADLALKWSQKDSNAQEKNPQRHLANSVTSQLRPEHLLQEASTALQQARKLYPADANLVVKWGQVLVQAGDIRGARTCLREILHQEEATQDALEQAASLLMYLKSPNDAALCLEKSINKYLTASPDLQAQRFARLAEAQKQANQPIAAVRSLEQALSIDPHRTELYQQLVNLLISRGDTDQAFSVLSRAKALISEPHALAELQVSTSALCRKTGRLAQALQYAEQALNSCAIIPSSKDMLSIRDTAATLYAELSWALLCPEQARNSLPGAVVPGTTSPDDPFKVDLDYYCLGAELALQFGEEIEAANYLTHALDLSPEHPWPLALQSRLLHKQKDQPLAVRTLQEAVERASQGFYAAPVYISLANAAANMAEWQTAVSMAQQAVKQAPGEPLSQFVLAQMLVQRAEFQHLCNDLDVINHAPGQPALQSDSQHTFLNAIQSSETILLQAYQESIALPNVHQDGKSMSQVSGEGETWKNAFAQIARWKCRGAAAFDSSLGNSEIPIAWMSWTGFILSNEDEVARLAAMRRQSKDEKPARPLILAARDNALLFPQDTLIQIQASLVMSGTNLAEALRYAQNAINLQTGLPKHPFTALAHITLAQIANLNGDLTAASQAVQIALSIWPDEARWLNLAARIALASPIPSEDSARNFDKAISYLEGALQLEPAHASHAILLSQAYNHANPQDQQTSRRALRILEKTSKLASHDPEVWLALADAYIHSGGRTNIKLAYASAERATMVAKEKNSRPALVQAYIALSSIALNNSEADESYRQARQALRIDPHNIQATILQVEALEALNRPEDALEVLDKALLNVSDSVPLQIKRASLLTQGKDMKGGMEILDQILKDHPDQPAAHCALAKTLYQVERKEEAIYHAQQALSQNNNGAQPLSGQEIGEMHTLLGDLYNQLGHLDQAIFQFNTALQQNPAHIDAYLALAQAYQKQRQFNKAQEVLDQAMNTAPADPRPYFQAGMAYKDGRNFESAASMLRKAAQLAPQDINIRKQLAAVMAVVVLNNTRNLGNRMVDEAR